MFERIQDPLKVVEKCLVKEMRMYKGGEGTLYEGIR